MHTPANTQHPGQSEPSTLADVSVRIASSLEAVEGLWRAFEASAFCTRFQCYDWLDSYLKAGGVSVPSEMAIAIVSSHCKLRMILPFAIEQKCGARRLCWLGHRVNDYNAPLVDLRWARTLTPGAMRAIWECVVSALPSVDYVHIQRQPVSLGGTLNPLGFLARTKDTCRAYVIPLEGRWAQAYEGIRSAKSRGRLREKLKRLASSGKVCLRRVRRPAEQRAMLRQLIAWKHRQLEAGGDSNPFADGAFEHFLACAVQSAGSYGPLRLFALEVDGSAAAAALCLAGRDDMNLFITAHDPQAYQQCSPGTLMMVKLMELTARSGRRVFDLSCGDEPYKRDWNAAASDLVVTTRPLSVRGYMAGTIEKARISTIKWTKARPWAFGLVRGYRRNWNRIRYEAAMPPALVESRPPLRAL